LMKRIVYDARDRAKAKLEELLAQQGMVDSVMDLANSASAAAALKHEL